MSAPDQIRDGVTSGYKAMVATHAVIELHTSDLADSPFCTECCHAWPCATLRTVADALEVEISE